MARHHSSSDPLLRLHDVTVRFGGILALDGISFDVQRGDVCGIIGPNGAGKTTLFNCLSRLYSPSAGAIAFDGKPLLAQPIHAMAALGIGRTFQNVALFSAMSVRANILVGGHSRGHAGYLPHFFGLASAQREEQALERRAGELMAMFDLEHLTDTPVAELGFGVRKRVEFARALMPDPTLLLLDEPAAGLNMEEVDGLRRLIARLRDEMHITILLVEHHLNLVMRVSDQVVAMNFGRKIADGKPAEVQSDPAVIEAYLGAPQS